MLRAMWFFVQIALVVAAALWLAARPGSIAIEWMDYHISLQAGIFLLILVVFVLVVLFFFRVLGALVSIPRRIVGFHEESARRRGYRALTKGFVSVAAGDAKKATQFSKQSRALLPDDRSIWRRSTSRGSILCCPLPGERYRRNIRPKRRRPAPS